MIGWDEILNIGLNKESAVMIWREDCIGNDAAKLGHPIVMAPNEYLYFDHRQFHIYEGNDPYSYFPGLCSRLVDVYNFNPLSLIENKNLILGVQACAWAEMMFDFKNVQWKVFPRMCAFSEMAWSKEELKDFEDFSKRLQVAHIKRLEKLNINFASI